MWSATSERTISTTRSSFFTFSRTIPPWGAPFTTTMRISVGPGGGGGVVSVVVVVSEIVVVSLVEPADSPSPPPHDASARPETKSASTARRPASRWRVLTERSVTMPADAVVDHASRSAARSTGAQRIENPGLSASAWP